MLVRVCVVLLFGIILEWNPTQSAPADLANGKGKGKEKVRPYEFGFSIEEQQHRHEKRDENGIVMGEFGFITADGIYHVTVYATDENGKFKILAMKSYPYRSPEKKIMAVTLPPIQRPAFSTAAPSDTKSCGGCVLPKKTKPPSPADVNVKKKQPDNSESLFRPLSKTISDNAGSLSKGVSALPPKPSSGSPSQLKPPKTNSIGLPKAAATGGNGKTYPLTPLQNTGPPKGGQDLPSRMSKSFPAIGNRFGSDDQFNPAPALAPSVSPQRTPPPQNTITQSTVKASSPSVKSSQPFVPKVGASTQTPNTSTAKTTPPVIKSTQPSQTSLLTSEIGAPPPTLNTNKLTPGQVAPTQSPTPTGSQQQNTIVPKAQTPTTKLTPVGTSGTKLTPNTITAAGSGLGVGSGGGGPLYRFNYVLDYNSHMEEGRTDGSKEGNYKAIDEGGIRRIVDYIANENGFQPHIKWERVPMSELPTGDNKLKEYEFIWFNKA